MIAAFLGYYLMFVRGWSSRSFRIPAAVSAVNSTHVGFLNVGNSCYRNSVLQSIIRLPNNSYRVNYRNESVSRVARSIADLYHDVYNVSRGPLDVSYVAQSLQDPRFTNGQSGDSQEFYSAIMDRLVDSDILNNSRYISIASRDCNCHSIQARNNETMLPIYFRDGIGNTDINLTDYLAEMMREDRSTMCPRCSNPLVTRTLLNPPDVFVMHFLRFHFDRATNSGRRLGNRVVFPINGFHFNGKWLRLHALINHQGGDRADSGHYTATVRDASSNTWYNYDDDLVSVVQEADVITSHAYMAFFIASGGVSASPP